MAKSIKKQKIANKMLDAMRFLSLCLEKKGAEKLTHCIVAHNSAVAFNGITALGAPVDEDLEACPEVASMILALERCGESYAIAQLASYEGDSRLSVRSGDFQAFVPCCDPSKLSWAAPDAPAIAINEKLSDCLKILAPVVSDKGAAVIQASIRIGTGTAMASNRVVILEAWHGLQLPDLQIPKSAASIITKCKKKLAWIGSSEKTATFGFEDGSWLRTNIYPLQEYAFSLDSLDTTPRELPLQFFEAVRNVIPFSESGMFYCFDDMVSSHNYERGSRLTLPVADSLKRRIYSIENWKLIEKHIKTIDENAHPNATAFFGEGLRGAIWHTTLTTAKPIEDDIPF